MSFTLPPPFALLSCAASRVEFFLRAFFLYYRDENKIYRFLFFIEDRVFLLQSQIDLILLSAEFPLINATDWFLVPPRCATGRNRQRYTLTYIERVQMRDEISYRRFRSMWNGTRLITDYVSQLTAASRRPCLLRPVKGRDVNQSSGQPPAPPAH